MDIFDRLLKSYVDAMPGGKEGFLKAWGFSQLAESLTRTKAVIGFCGVHRSGKTTLARALAEHLNYKYVDCSASPTFVRLGIEVQDVPKMEFKERLSIQKEIVQDFVTKVEGKQNIVTDRTPLDHLMYTMAEILPGKTVENEYKIYEALCYLVLSNFSHIFLVHPIEGADRGLNKASMDYPYRQHLDAIITGLFHKCGIRDKLDISIELHTERMASVLEFLEMQK